MSQRITFDFPDQMAETIQLIAYASRQSQRQVILRLMEYALEHVELEPPVARAARLLAAHPELLNQIPRARRHARAT